MRSAFERLFAKIYAAAESGRPDSPHTAMLGVQDIKSEIIMAMQTGKLSRREYRALYDLASVIHDQLRVQINKEAYHVEKSLFACEPESAGETCEEGGALGN